jgi:hypothetical protein
MEKELLIDSVMDQHEPHSQRAAAVGSALASVFTALEDLAKYGHIFHLVEGTSDQPQEWPKMVYRDGQDSNGNPIVVQKVVNDEEELKAIGDGWRDAPMERK